MVDKIPIKTSVFFCFTFVKIVDEGSNNRRNDCCLYLKNIQESIRQDISVSFLLDIQFMEIAYKSGLYVVSVVQRKTHSYKMFRFNVVSWKRVHT